MVSCPTTDAPVFFSQKPAPPQRLCWLCWASKAVWIPFWKGAPIQNHPLCPHIQKMTMIQIMSRTLLSAICVLVLIGSPLSRELFTNPAMTEDEIKSYKQMLDKRGKSSRKIISDLKKMQLLLSTMPLSQGNCEGFPDIDGDAKGGHPEQQYILAQALLEGWCVRQDSRKGLHWLRKAADAGFVYAQTDLGFIILGGKKGIPASPSSAYPYLKKAAEKGVPRAQYSVGYMHQNGVGIPQNYKLAREGSPNPPHREILTPHFIWHQIILRA